MYGHTFFAQAFCYILFLELILCMAIIVNKNDKAFCLKKLMIRQS